MLKDGLSLLMVVQGSDGHHHCLKESFSLPTYYSSTYPMHLYHNLIGNVASSVGNAETTVIIASPHYGSERPDAPAFNDSLSRQLESE